MRKVEFEKTEKAMRDPLRALYCHNMRVCGRRAMASITAAVSLHVSRPAISMLCVYLSVTLSL